MPLHPESRAGAGRSLAAIDTAAAEDNAVGPGAADETTGVAFARITYAMATRRTESNGGGRHRLSKSVRATARDRRPGRYVAQTRRGPNRASSRRPWTASRFDLADLRNAAVISRSVLPAHRHGCDPERFVTRCNRHPVNPIGCRLGHFFGARPDGERSSGCRFDAKELPDALGYTELILILKRLPKRGRLRGAGFCWRDRRALGCGIPRRGRPSALRHRGATVSSPFPFTPSHCVQTNLFVIEHQRSRLPVVKLRPFADATQTVRPIGANSRQSVNFHIVSFECPAQALVTKPTCAAVWRCQSPSRGAEAPSPDRDETPAEPGSPQAGPGGVRSAPGGVGDWRLHDGQCLSETAPGNANPVTNRRVARRDRQGAATAGAHALAGLGGGSVRHRTAPSLDVFAAPVGDFHLGPGECALAPVRTARALRSRSGRRGLILTY